MRRFNVREKAIISKKSGKVTATLRQTKNLRIYPRRFFVELLINYAQP